MVGTTYYGTNIPDSLCFDLLDEYYSLGGRTIDTARVYGQSEDLGVSKSELVIGRWLKQRGLREEFSLITKGCHTSLTDPGKSRLDPEDIRRDLNDSLSCLNVNYVDIYFLHRDDGVKPVGPIIDTLDEFVKAGKIRAIGASNWSLDRILEANAYAKKNNKTPFTVSQIQWSVAECTNDLWGDPSLVFMDSALRSRYIDEGLPVMAYASQAKGLFSKYIADPDTAITPKSKRFFTPGNMKKLEIIRKICAETGKSPAAVITAYITSHTLQAAAIIGCSNTVQLRDTMSGCDLKLTPDMINALENA